MECWREHVLTQRGPKRAAGQYRAAKKKWPERPRHDLLILSYPVQHYQTPRPRSLERSQPVREMR